MLEAQGSVDTQTVQDLRELVNQMKQEETGRTETKSAKAIAFERLFPGMNFNKLSIHDPANSDAILSQLILDEASRESRIANGEVVLERVNWSHPDKLTAELQMAGMVPIDEKLDPNIFKGLLTKDEQFGGVCVKNILFPTGEGNKIGLTIGKAVGVLGPDGKSRGFIFIAGQQQPPEKTRGATPLSKASTKPVAAPSPA